MSNTGITRLVYSPKVYVYVKNNNGTILDLSPFVVSGNVTRLINQVSTATVVLRNPMKRFTTPVYGAPFHPQDPITIYLERVPGFPVRVFTGYLDSTPYYQMYPGPITLQASCTLKRLLYTWFDPSLPYLISFFEQYGWYSTGQGSLYSTSALGQTPATASVTDVLQGKSAFDNLQDGSLGKLLWAVLNDIGQWQDANIWIEPLPNGANGLAARMAQLMNTIDSENALAASQLSGFLSQIVGTGSAGSGGNNVTLGNGSITSVKGLTIKGIPIQPGSQQLQNLNTALQVASGLGASQKVMQAMVFAGIAEDSWNNQSGTVNLSGTYYGVFSSQNDPTMVNLTKQATAWLTGNGGGFHGGGGIKYAAANPGASLVQIAEAVEDSGPSYQGQSGYSLYAPESIAIVAAYDGGSSSTTPVSPSVSTNSSTTTAIPNTKSTATSGQQLSVFDCIANAANKIAQLQYPYAYGGGHLKVGQPNVDPPNENGTGTPVNGFDCSGSVAAVLYSATALNYNSAPPTQDEIPALKAAGFIPGVGQGPYSVTVWVDPAVHTFMKIGNAYWGTTAGGTLANPRSGPGWLTGAAPNASDPSFQPFYLPQNKLTPLTTYRLALGAGGSTIPGGTSGAASNITGSAEAFTAQVNFPSIEDQVTALMLGQEHKGLMHDQQLLPFVQQLAQASMRSFMSLPNGDFYAFYPDYFGEMGQHPPYWLIDDIEIMNGGISLSDDALATHVFAVGDNTYPVNEELLNELFSAGTISIFNAFLPTNILTNANKEDHIYRGTADIMDNEEAKAFINRYGARPLVQDYPMVRSPIYEMLLAYQQFMLAWSNQFLTPFTFTFMPELFPGGKVGFPQHGLQMYINSVTHDWDFSEGGGFTTTAQLSAPAVMEGSTNPDLPPLMVSALVEPIRGQTGQSSVATPPPTFTGSNTPRGVGAPLTNPNTQGNTPPKTTKTVTGSGGPRGLTGH